MIISGNETMVKDEYQTLVPNPDYPGMKYRPRINVSSNAFPVGYDMDKKVLYSGSGLKIPTLFGRVNENKNTFSYPTSDGRVITIGIRWTQDFKILALPHP